MVWAVSPAQNNPSGFLHRVLITDRGVINMYRKNDCNTPTKGVNQQVVLRFVDITVGLMRC